MCRTVKDLSWAAGFIAGEGSISLQGRNNNCVVLDVGQTEKEPILKLISLFGGSFYVRRTPKGAPFYRWSVYGDKAIQIIMTLYSLFNHQAKRERAEQAISVWRNKSKIKNKRDDLTLEDLGLA